MPQPVGLSVGLPMQGRAEAPQAAGVIHTDFEKGFIKAEVIGFDDLVETGSIAEARAKGKARIEARSTSCKT